MNIEHFEETDSTNEVLKRKKDKREYDLVYADYQTDGKGRRGNKWLSDKGSGLFSFLVKDGDYGEKTALLSGYAVYKVIEKFLDSNSLKFKWPNDIYYEGKKISGILIEKCDNFLIIGIGININNTDFGIFKNSAISLKLITGKEYSIKELILEIVGKIKSELEKKEDNWVEIIEFLNKNHFLNGKLVENNKKEQYEIIKINNDGSLKVKKNGHKNYEDIYSDEIKGIKEKQASKSSR